MEPRKIVECVPNFSEGRDREKIDLLAEAIRSVSGLALLGVDPGADANRTVYTFAGEPEAVLAGALAAARAAWSCIDMSTHRGAHPRIGALDVCPFVPVSGLSMEECAALAARFGEALAAELGIPVYLYERSARSPGRVSLADIRSGEYEGLPAKLKDPAWQPDFGPAAFVPRWGATVTGAREFLVAYNVNLNTGDEKAARDIAFSLRESGRIARNADGSPQLNAGGEIVRVPGRLKALRAIGWYMPQYGCAQVSMNLLDYRTTGLAEAFEAVSKEAEARGLRTVGSELVGLLPLEALRSCGRHFAVKAGRSPGLPDAELVELGAEALGLSSVSTFDAQKRIVEWALGATPTLAGKSLSSFADAVSTDTPAPGGGSVAALAGALGASLAAMADNLGAPKSQDPLRGKALADAAMAAQALKAELLGLVDADAAAFEAVLAASRLPRRTEEERARRIEAVKAAYRNAAELPLSTALASLEALRLCRSVVEQGRRSSATDGAVGAMVAFAGVSGALLNVRVNLPFLGDESFRASCLAELGRIEAEAARLKAETEALVAGYLKG